MKAKLEMQYDVWLAHVVQTKEAILKEPDKYIDDDLPDTSILTAAIEKVFEGFIQDQKIRNLQKGPDYLWR